MQQRDFTTNHQQTKPIEELFFKFIIIGDPGIPFTFRQISFLNF